MFSHQKRLPPPHPCPATRQAAALKIQRAYRTHLLLRSVLSQIEHLSTLLERADVAFQTRRGGVHSSDTLRTFSDTLSLLKLALHSTLHPQTNATQIDAVKLMMYPSVRIASEGLRRRISEETEVLEVAKVDTWVRELRVALKSAARRRRTSRTLSVVFESDESEELDSTMTTSLLELPITPSTPSSSCSSSSYELEFDSASDDSEAESAATPVTSDSESEDPGRSRLHRTLKRKPRIILSPRSRSRSLSPVSEAKSLFSPTGDVVIVN